MCTKERERSKKPPARFRYYVYAEKTSGGALVASRFFASCKILRVVSGRGNYPQLISTVAQFRSFDASFRPGRLGWKFSIWSEGDFRARRHARRPLYLMTRRDHSELMLVW